MAFAVIFATLSWLRFRQGLFASSAGESNTGLDYRFLLGHAVSISAFLASSWFLYSPNISPLTSDILAGFWLMAGLAAIGFGCFTLIRPGAWLGMMRGTGSLWILASVAVLVACLVGNSSRNLWPQAADLTFRLTAVLLRPFISDLVVDPSKMAIGSRHFSVEIAPQCSGLEGVGLILAFGVAWLVLFRKQCRFPQALILLPAGVVLIFALNSVRIAALVLIGNAGAESIATGGFHSQAGWIVFNLVALGFTVGSSSLPWFTKQTDTRRGETENPTAAWLAPLVSVLAAGMVSHALSGGFEWLYPLRLMAAVAVLVWFRRPLLVVNWRVDWTGPAIGVAVFALWIGLDRLLPSAGVGMPEALVAAGAGTRDAWLVCRVLAGAITVPIVEELAFRGYLYRRLISAEFETVPLQRLSWVALAVSSVVFGIPHGSRWFAGAVAGALYAGAMLRRGSIGNAVAAHAVTNALIAADVLVFGNWNLW